MGSWSDALLRFVSNGWFLQNLKQATCSAVISTFRSDLYNFVNREVEFQLLGADVTVSGVQMSTGSSQVHHRGRPLEGTELPLG